MTCPKCNSTNIESSTYTKTAEGKAVRTLVTLECKNCRHIILHFLRDEPYCGSVDNIIQGN